jgi:hypothetical protein
LFTEENDTNWIADITGSSCICWMQEKSIDADVDVAVANHSYLILTEVEWHSGIVTTSLDKLWNEFIYCYDHARLSDDRRNEGYLHMSHGRPYRIFTHKVAILTVLHWFNPYSIQSIRHPDDQMLTMILLLKELISSLDESHRRVRHIYLAVDLCGARYSLQISEE